MIETVDYAATFYSKRKFQIGTENRLSLCKVDKSTVMCGLISRDLYQSHRQVS